MAKHILFLCRENSARSQIAEGLARHFLGDQADVASAGSQLSGRIHPMAITVMAEIGIDISHHRSKGLDEINLERFDLVVTVCDDKECPVLPADVKRVRWNLPDPARADVPHDEQLSKFRKIRDQIRERVLSLRVTHPVW